MSDDWWTSDPVVAPPPKDAPVALDPGETVLTVGGKPKAPSSEPHSGGNFWENDPIAPPAPKVAPTWTDIIADVGKSAGIGLAKGVTGLIGMPGDIANAGSRIGVFPPTGNPLPSSAEVQSNVEGVTGKFYEPKTNAGKFAQSAAEFVPGALAGPGGVVRNVAAGIGAGLGSEAAGQVTEGSSAEPYARFAGGVAGMFAPAAIAKSAARAVTPLPATAERSALAATLDAEGVPMTAGQRTGNKPLQWAESAVGDMPGAGGKYDIIRENQQKAFNAAVLKRAGINADIATPEVMRGGYDMLRSRFGQLSSRNTLKLDEQLGEDILNLARQYDSVTLPSQQKPLVRKTLVDLVHEGEMSGMRYQSLRSQLSKAGKGYSISDPAASDAMFSMRNALDSAMERSINPADKGAWGEVRRHYSNWKSIERAATGAGINVAEGNISPSVLRQTVASKNRGAYARGEGDLAELSRAGTAIVPPPNSGTAPRAHVQHLMEMGGGLAGAVVGAGHGMEGAGIGAIAGLAAAPVAGRVLMSRPVQSYLGNQILPRGEFGPRGSTQALIATELMRAEARKRLDADRQKIRGRQRGE